MRHAVYYVPEPGSPLWRFGSSVIGYDSATGAVVDHPDHPLFRSDDHAQWSAAPRAYGFHATLRAPFTLIPDIDEDLLLQAAAAFASRQQSVVEPPLRVAELGSFVALVPSQPSDAINAVAAATVEAFEPFRAPLSEDDRARRLKAPLSERERALLDRWGYPYVFDAFRFHMTLTGPIGDAARRAEVAAGLAKLNDVLAEPFALDAIAVCRQETREAPFRLVQRFPFPR